MCYICTDNELSFNMSVSVADSIAKTKWTIIGENVPVCNKCHDLYLKIAGIVDGTDKKKKIRTTGDKRSRDMTKAIKANSVEVTCPECEMVCKSYAGLGSHRSRKHGVEGKTKLKGGSLYEVMREKQEKLVHYPVYECRWFGEDTENTAEAKCGCVKSKTAKGHTELLAHEKHSHSKKFHPISEEFRKTTYRSRKIQA